MNRTNEQTNGQYFSVETAERLPNEKRRRELLCARVSELVELREQKQKELDELMMSPVYDVILMTDEIDLSDERVVYLFSLMDEIEEISSSIAWTRRDIGRLDAGETLADIYRNIFS